VGGGPAGGGAWGRTPSTGSPSNLPRWGEARSLSTRPWTTTRGVLFKKSPKFLADANFDLVILAAAKRRESVLDFQTAQEAGLAGMEDPDVLAVAAQEGRVLLTHDVRTMPWHFAAFISEHTSAGVLLIRQSLPRRQVVEDLLLIWVAMEAEEWINRIMSLPL
jgi:predicted nuclease of predicted toxin-antitoxin system